MESAVENPYETPANSPLGRDAILSAAAGIKMGIRRDRKRRVVYFGLGTLFLFLSMFSACACYPQPWWVKAQMVLTAILFFAGGCYGLKILSARRQLHALADCYGSAPAD